MTKTTEGKCKECGGNAPVLGPACGTCSRAAPPATERAEAKQCPSCCPNCKSRSMIDASEIGPDYWRCTECGCRDRFVTPSPALPERPKYEHAPVGSPVTPPRLIPESVFRPVVSEGWDGQPEAVVDILRKTPPERPRMTEERPMIPCPCNCHGPQWIGERHHGCDVCSERNEAERQIIEDKAMEFYAEQQTRELQSELSAAREREARLAAEPRLLWPKCAICGNGGTCFGVYEDPSADVAFACSGCCGHGNEDGWCKPVREDLAAVFLASMNELYRSEARAEAEVAALKKEKQQAELAHVSELRRVESAERDAAELRGIILHAAGKEGG